MSNFQDLTSCIFYSYLPALATIVKDSVFVLQNLWAATSYPIILMIFDGPLLIVFTFKWKLLCISSGLKKTASHTAVQSSQVTSMLYDCCMSIQ